MAIRQKTHALAGGSPVGAIVPLSWNRTDAGTAQLCDSPSYGKTQVEVFVPVVKLDGSENPASGGVIVFYTDSDAAPSFASTPQTVDVGRGATATIPMTGDRGEGFLWACARGVAAVEIHVREVRS